MYMTFGAGRNCIRNFADTCTCSGCSSAFGSQEHATGLWSPDKYVLFDLSQIRVNASDVDSENAGLRCVYTANFVLFILLFAYIIYPSQIQAHTKADIMIAEEMP